MEPDQLKSGDTVIPLAGLVVTAAIVAGAVNGAVVAWKLDEGWYLILGALVVGAVVCAVLAKFLSNIIFPVDIEGHVFVVKAGPSALPLTLKAAFAGSILALLVSGLGFAFLLGGQQLFVSTWLIVALVSLLVAIAWGLLSALV